MDSQKQIEQMANFILNEAKDKAAEMEAKTLEDFNIEKLKKVQAMKEKVRQDTIKKQTQMKTQKAVEQSQAANKCRLKKAATAAAMIDKVQEDTLVQIAKLSDNEKLYSDLLSKLILESAMMMLDDTLYVRVREQDAEMVKGLFSHIESQYVKILGKAGVSESKASLKLKIDHEHLSKKSPGGVMVYDENKKIHVDNSLEHRLQLAVQVKMPELKQLMFA
eukprot:GHVH01010900.1.p1 GENE.GHVH01010900.1~~GHVH01010900.1.p1  ORF type:complete len:220 (+),score=53.98 GHVH01010900.1:87-746(+)